MESNLASPGRHFGSPGGVSRPGKKQKQVRIKPLALAARTSNDGDAEANNKTTLKPQVGCHSRTLHGTSLPWLMVLLAGSLFVSHQCIIGARSAGFSLDFSPKPAQVTNHDPTARLTEVLMSDCGDEFAETSAILMHMKGALEEYGRLERLEPLSEEMKVHLVSANLARLGVNLPDEPQVQRVASELDYVFATFWVEFLPLIQRIVTEKPQELSEPINLAFRCARYPELMSLYKLSTQSGLYTMVWQVFASELYLHCVRRKLTTLELKQVKPSSTVRQFVDIYIDFSPHYSALLARSKAPDAERLYASKMLAASGLEFVPERALATHGALLAAANLVFDTDTSSPLSLASSDGSQSSQRLVDKFRAECQDLTGKLSKEWGDMDEVAGFMSSSMNDLVTFSRRIKVASPQLIYGSVCGQLI